MYEMLKISLIQIIFELIPIFNFKFHELIILKHIIFNYCEFSEIHSSFLIFDIFRYQDMTVFKFYVVYVQLFD